MKKLVAVTIFALCAGYAFYWMQKNSGHESEDNKAKQFQDSWGN